MEIRILKLCTLFPFHKSSHIWKVLHQCLTPSAVQFTNIPTCSLEPQEHRRDSSPLRYTNVWHHWQSNSPTYICSLEPGSIRGTLPPSNAPMSDTFSSNSPTYIHHVALNPGALEGLFSPPMHQYLTPSTEQFTNIHIHTHSLKPRSIGGTLPPPPSRCTWVWRYRHTLLTQVFTKIHHIWLGRPCLITNKEVTRVPTSSSYMAIQWNHQLHDFVRM